MLVRSMCNDEIHHESHTVLLQCSDQKVHVRQSAILWVDGLVVRDVVAHVGLWRLVD